MRELIAVHLLARAELRVFQEPLIKKKEKKGGGSERVMSAGIAGTDLGGFKRLVSKTPPSAVCFIIKKPMCA